MGRKERGSEHIIPATNKNLKKIITTTTAIMIITVIIFNLQLTSDIQWALHDAGITQSTLRLKLLAQTCTIYSLTIVTI